MRGKDLCYHHGGAPGSGGAGRPIKHALYSKYVPPDWQEDYEYFKSDPDILNLQSEIAVARVVRARFMKNFQSGVPLSAEMVDALIEHGIKVAKLCESHNKIQYGETTILKLDGAQKFVDAVMDTVDDVLNECIADTDLRTAIKDLLATRLVLKGRQQVTEQSGG
jgi:pyruvate carboxylase